jgi:hypothetical protein
VSSPPSHDDLETRGRVCVDCRSPVAVLARTDVAETIQLDPRPVLGGEWEVSLDRRKCRRARRAGSVRYRAHAQTCTARHRPQRMGLCRGRSACRELVVLYGQYAYLLCPRCMGALEAWRATPAGERGPWPLR